MSSEIKKRAVRLDYFVVPRNLFRSKIMKTGIEFRRNGAYNTYEMFRSYITRINFRHIFNGINSVVTKSVELRLFLESAASR